MCVTRDRVVWWAKITGMCVTRDRVVKVWWSSVSLKRLRQTWKAPVQVTASGVCVWLCVQTWHAPVQGTASGVCVCDYVPAVVFCLSCALKMTWTRELIKIQFSGNVICECFSSASHPGLLLWEGKWGLSWGERHEIPGITFWNYYNNHILVTIPDHRDILI